MTTSRSIASASRAIAWTVCALVLALCAWPTAAHARKRIVVLEFTGPKAEDFQEDLEKLLKKKHSLVPLAKWDATADDLNATKVSDAHIRKVAAELNVDGVITGKTEKRGSKYYLHLQLRAGATGKVEIKPDIIERNPGLGEDGRADVTDTLLPAIDDLPPLSSGDDDEESDEDDDRGKGKGKRSGFSRDDDDDDEDDEDDDRAKGKGKKPTPVAKGKGKRLAEDDDEDADADRDDDEDEDDTRAKGKGKKPTPVAKGKGKRLSEDDDDADRDDDRGRGRDDDEDADRGEDDEDDDRVAMGDDEERDDRDDRDDDRDRDDRDGGDDDSTASLHPALEVAAGLSFTGRKLGFTTNLVTNAPQGYSGAPVPGVRITVDAFPLAFNKKNRSFTRNLGLTALFDRAIKIESQLQTAGMTYTLPTVEQHLAIGVIYRHPLSATLTLEGSLRYNKRKFVINKNSAPMDAVDIPNTNYTYIDPGVGVRYVLSPKAALSGDARFLLITDTGEMQSPDQYGASTVTGVDLSVGLDYQIATKIVLRASAGLATIGYAFKGNGALTNNRDGDAASIDVSGARDTYFGGSAGAAYAF